MGKKNIEVKLVVIALNRTEEVDKKPQSLIHSFTLF